MGILLLILLVAIGLGISAFTDGSNKKLNKMADDNRKKK